MRKFIIALAAVIIIGAFFSAFIEISNTEEENVPDDIVMSVGNLNYELDRTADLTSDDNNIICAVSRGLVKLNNSNEVVLDLAKDLQVSNDGIEYDFILRDDIYWSDGERIKPEDIVEYFQTLILSENPNSIEALLNIYGVSGFKQGKGGFEKNVAITSGENNIKIRLNKKNDNFLNELSKPKYRLRRNLYLWNDIKANYSRMVYSGDYIISDVKESSIELTKRDDENRNKILLVKDDSKEDAMAAYEIGGRDIVVDPHISQVSRLDENKKVLASPSGNGIYLVANSEKMNLGVRKEFVKSLYKAANAYEEQNKKAVKFSEGSYFEKEMDDLDKLQSRKVSIVNNEGDSLPGNINMLIEDDEVEEDFVKFIVDYFKENEDVNIVYKKRGETEDNEKEFDAALLNKHEDVSMKNELYKEIKQVFNKENSSLFKEESRMEEGLFDSYIAVPVMFINRNIAVSDRVENIQLDGNGNIDFSFLD